MPSSLSGLHRGVAGAANTDPDGRLRVEVDERPDENPPPSRTRGARARVPRRRRGDPRAARRRRARERVPALDHRAGRAGRHVRLRARPQLRPEGRAAADARRGRAAELALRLQRDRLAELQVRQRIRDDVESGAQKQQREYFLRKQMDSIRKELGDDDASVAEEYREQDRRGRDARRGARAGRARGRPARAHGRVHRRVVDDPHLPRLADRRAVVEALRRAARPGARARGARRRPRRARRRQGADHRVPGRAQAARRAGRRRTTAARASS